MDTTIHLTDLISADDIEHISREVEKYQQLLTSIETEVANICIQLKILILKLSKQYHGQKYIT